MLLKKLKGLGECALLSCAGLRRGFYNSSCDVVNGTLLCKPYISQEINRSPEATAIGVAEEYRERFGPQMASQFDEVIDYLEQHGGAR